MTKWQLKFNDRIYYKSGKECPFCKKKGIRWRHYMECHNLPEEIKQARRKFDVFLTNKKILLNMYEIMNDINLEKVQDSLRRNGYKTITIY